MNHSSYLLLTGAYSSLAKLTKRAARRKFLADRPKLPPSPTGRKRSWSETKVNQRSTTHPKPTKAKTGRGKVMLVTCLKCPATCLGWTLALRSGWRVFGGSSIGTCPECR